MFLWSKKLYKTLTQNSSLLYTSQVSVQSEQRRLVIWDGMKWWSGQLISSRVAWNDLYDNRLISGHARCGRVMIMVSFFSIIHGSMRESDDRKDASMAMCLSLVSHLSFSVSFSFSLSLSLSFNCSLRALDFLIRQLKVSRLVGDLRVARIIYRFSPFSLA